MTTRNRDVLISGASVTGPVLAYWLARYGFRPVVVERAKAPREGGYPIDVRGQGVDVAGRMGVLPELRRASVEMAALTFVDREGRRSGGFDARALREALPTGDIELPRGDLVRILHEATWGDVEYVYDDSIKTLDQDDDGVTVSFERGAARRFDLVIGADGLHSIVRRLAFGEESRFIHHLGSYVAAADVPKELVTGRYGEDDQVVLYNEPGRMAGIYSYLDRATGIFVFRPPGPVTGERDGDRQRRLLAEAFAVSGWQVPELLAAVTAAPDFYFDSVSQIRMTPWSRGRVALAGDAAHCPALLSGQGTTLAMVGAYVLAGELHAAGGDHHRAFARYEAEHRAVVAKGQARVKEGDSRLVPATARRIRTRNRLSRLAGLAVAAAPLLRLTHRPAPRLRHYDDKNLPMTGV
ncbi:FAD-dependent monooxygenase [Sphaerisporangium corydalis]|uniref:FAD-dependent monooxygenase n=1 Tax=Sphaerisporangium corydalis TaxID=1441875 RepID=A0ABV9EPP2_9ACTN|nr:FAD-dependent monooxygenase [Sphaerisporangium corydalis]